MTTHLIIQKSILSLIFLLSYFSCSIAQVDTTQNEYRQVNASSQVHKKRRNLLLSLGGVSYALGSYALYRTWYEDYPRSGFHSYNDWGEWRSMDKIGHIYSTYSQGSLAYQGWKWAGLSDKKAVWTGVGTSLLFQSTVEIMDGFSEKWGFSWTDMGANLVGAGLFASQQLTWDEQRILMKVSSSPVNYREVPEITSRVDDLYGTGYLQRWLKDYNGQTLWLSANIKSFLPQSKLPKWLNVSFGYGAENMYGGFSNEWSNDGRPFETNLPRYSQFYLSLDMNLSKIDTESPFLRTILDILNVFKIPFSAVEVNTLGEVKFHLIHF